MIPRTVPFLVALFTLTAAPPSQSTWLGVSPVRSPSPREGAVMAYDEHRGVVVLFGGRDDHRYFAETWEWDGYLWTRAGGRTAPPARANTGMVYDSKRKQMLLFGGDDGRTDLADTWAYDGKAWKQLTPSTSPGKRWGHGMAYDSARQVVVLHSGARRGNRPWTDTWEWNGTTWTDKKATSGGRYIFAMSYDAKRRVCVAYGGHDYRDTAIYNGSSWRKGSQFGHAGVVTVWDSHREVVVAFGGSHSPNYFNRTDEWNGVSWSALNVRRSPTVRSSHAMAYDSKRRRIVLFGGRDLAGKFGDTWELVHDCVCVGKGHYGGGLSITCLSPARVGSTFGLAFKTSQNRGTLYIGPPLTKPYLTLKQPLVCIDGVFHTQPVFAVPVTGSPAIFRATVPNQPQLIGGRLRVQATAPEILGCLMLTDALDVTIR